MIKMLLSPNNINFNTFFVKNMIFNIVVSLISL